MAPTSDIAQPDSQWAPEAIVFDLLTALLDSWTVWDASTPSGTAEEGRRWRGKYLDITFGQGAYAPYEDLVRQAAREAGLPESAPETLLQKWGSLEPWEEVPEVLEALKQLKTSTGENMKLGIITNCSKVNGHIAADCVARRLQSSGDAVAAFDAVITAEESGFYKPELEAYNAILGPLGVEAKDVLFVAGSAGDVQGATRAGFRVVWHNRVGLAAKGDAVPLREGKTLKNTLSDYL